MGGRGIPMSKVNWKTMRGPGDCNPPEYPEPPECPECDGPMVEVGGDTFECENADCGHVECNEPDFEQMAEDQAEARYGRWNDG